MSNIVTADLSGGRRACTEARWQYDYGQMLHIVGAELPGTFEVHFGNESSGTSKTEIGENGVVAIPDEYLLTGKDIHAWIYLHSGADDGETEYRIVIPVNRRAKPTSETPTPEEQSLIEQALAALNAAVAECESNVSHYPIIINDYWCIWDAVESQYVSTNIHAQGDKGDKGDKGDTGATPSISIGTVTTGLPGSSASAEITGTAEFPVLSLTIPRGDKGEKGDTGATPNLTIGQVTTLLPGSSASVTITGTAENPVMNMALPRGDKGEKGDPFTVKKTFPSIADMNAYTGTDVVEGDFVMISSNVQDPDNAKLFLRGADSYTFVTDLSGSQGMKGDTGNGISSAVLNADYTLTLYYTNGTQFTTSSIRGEQGEEGDSAYVYIRYSAVEPTSDSDMKTTPDDWMGIYSGIDETAPTTYTSYTWYKIKGETGQTGATGQDGYSPSASVSKSGGTATITITDKNGTTTAGVSDGDPTTLIDDTAGDGDTGKAWSADKLVDQFALKADKTDTVLLTTLSLGRKENTTVGTNSIALGANVTASGNYSYAEGGATNATAAFSHAEGLETTASGAESHAEGQSATASGAYSHAEGYTTSATGSGSHAEGFRTKTVGNNSHAEGYYTQAYGNDSHAEGRSSSYTSTSYGARGKADHVEGYNTLANSGSNSSYYGAHAEGNATKATNNGAHAEGKDTTASGLYTHAEGQSTTASNLASHAEGSYGISSGQRSHAEGYGTTASGDDSHAEGNGTTASGKCSHAEGSGTTASGNYSHVEGYNSSVSGNYSHVHGVLTTAYSTAQTAFGVCNIPQKRLVRTAGTVTINSESVSDWNPNMDYYSGDVVKVLSDGAYVYYVCHATAKCKLFPPLDSISFYGATNSWHPYTPSSGQDMSGVPEFNINTQYAANTVVKITSGSGVKYYQNHHPTYGSEAPSYTVEAYWHTQPEGTTVSTYDVYESDYVEFVGNGITEYSNARALDWNGNEYLKGDIYVGCNADSSGGTKLQNATVMTGADGTNAGSSGLVPAPTATDNTKYLRGDGTWQTVSAGSVLPTVTSSDNGKVLEVVSGAWATGTEKAPTASPVFTGSISLGRKENTTIGTNSFAVGYDVEASAYQSHAEGSGTKASANQTHSEGYNTTASGIRSHVEGDSSKSTGDVSHAEGKNTTASGFYSHSEGNYTTANHKSQHAAGEYNVLDASSADASNRGNYVEIIGNGTGTSARSNARALDWNGNEYLKGDIYVGCNADSTGGTKLTAPVAMTGADGTNAGTAGYVPAPAATDNTKFLKGNGTWDSVPNPSVMTGATSQAAGTSGLVPAPSAGDNAKYLRGDGTWTDAIGTSTEHVSYSIATTDWTLSNGVYTASVTDSCFTGDTDEKVTYDSSILNLKSGLSVEKNTSTNSMVFTTKVLPGGTISGTILCWGVTLGSATGVSY